MAGSSTGGAPQEELSIADEVLEEIADDDQLPAMFTLDTDAIANDIDFLLPYVLPVLMRRLADEMQDKKVAHQSVIDWLRAKVVRTTLERRAP